MAKRYIQEGDVLDYTASSDISAGDLVRIGNMVGVALDDIATGETGSVKVTGVWDLPKASGAIAVGDVIDFDVSASNVTTGLTPASGDVTGMGVAVAAAAAGDPTVHVRLTPGAGTVN